MQEKKYIQLINDHIKIIYKVCNMYAVTDSAKEDLHQEIILNAWKGIRNFKGESLFSTWLYRVALNTALTFRRKEAQYKQAGIVAEIMHSQNSGNDSEEQLTAMYNAINTLSDIDKALVMLYLDDYSYHEMSDVLGITPNNIAVKMNRIKKKLKDESEKYFTKQINK